MRTNLPSEVSISNASSLSQSASAVDSEPRASNEPNIGLDSAALKAGTVLKAGTAHKTGTALKIAIVTGEASGDLLGAGLMNALQLRYPEAQFVGIGGDKMLAQGFDSWFPMDRLAVMGLVEPLKRLPELLRIRKTLKDRFIASPPDLFIGIDSPDFNLDLSLSLRQAGIKTAHYVSPSVWAWRQGRIKKIAKAVDLMLTLFPFEAQFYRDHQVPVAFVGHPLADDFPLQPEMDKAREQLGLRARQKAEKKYVALMPGSRQGEVAKMGRLFLEAAQQAFEQDASLHFLLPTASDARYQQLEPMLKEFPSLPITLLKGQSHLAMSSANALLIASGTTSLEAMLLKKPTIVAYKTSTITFAIMSRLVKVPYVALPNLLANAPLMPEYLQDKATPEALSEALMQALKDINTSPLQKQFLELHQSLRCNASETAATALSQLLS